MDQGSRMFADDDSFLRRIHPQFYDHNTGKVSTAAFQNASGTNRMSVNWMKLSTVDDTLRGYTGFGVASIYADLCWSLNQRIESVPSQGNPAHCDVVGEKPTSVKRKFRDMAKYLQYPSPP